MTLRLVKMAGHCLVKDQFAGIPEDDILLQARVTIEAVAEGRGGPRAAARLAAAQLIFSKAFLPAFNRPAAPLRGEAQDGGAQGPETAALARSFTDVVASARPMLAWSEPGGAP
jgi:hypothetical protein